MWDLDLKKAELRRIYAFDLSCWRRLFRVPWTGRRSNQSILKEISPEYSLEGYAEAESPIVWPPDAKNWLIGKDPDAGGDWRQEEKGTTEDEKVGWHHQLMYMSLSKLQEFWWTGKPGVLQSLRSQRVRHNWATELNWTEDHSTEVLNQTLHFNQIFCDSWAKQNVREALF